MEVIKKLKELKPILQEKFGIKELAVFGSYARGEETNNSDIDIAILKMDIKNGFDIIKSQYFLEKELNKKVDIGMYKSMKSFIKNRIKKDFIYVWYFKDI